jgi:DNA-directed RNA polymerase sigma subunit (sigma70/sigma32)
VRSEKRKFFGESEYDTKNKFEFRRVKEGLENDLKREPTKNEIEEKMGKKRLEIVARAFRKIVSFDDNIGQEDDFDGSTLGDKIISPEVSVEEEIITRELNNNVEQYIGTLDNLDKEIFFYMSDIYGEREGKPVNTRDISQKLGTPEWEVIIRYEEMQNDLKIHLGTKEEVEGEVEAVKIPTNEINISNQKKIIENGLSLLSRQQANVIRWRFGLDGGPLRTFQDVGDEIKSTRQNIQLLEKTAIMNLEIRGQIECVKILKTIIKKGGLSSKRKRMQGKEI